jgi:hypothetical protein
VRSGPAGGTAEQKFMRNQIIKTHRRVAQLLLF